LLSSFKIILFVSATTSFLLTGCLQTVKPKTQTAADASQPALTTVSSSSDQPIKNNQKAQPSNLQPAAKTPASTPATTVALKSTNISGTGGAITHSQFVALIGKRKLSTLVGTQLQLNLKRGGDGGWAGYVEDEQSLVFFSCPESTRTFKGGRLIATVSKIRSNDNGVFVTLDRCDDKPI